MTHTILAMYKGYGQSEKQREALNRQREARNIVAEMRNVKPEHKGSMTYKRSLNRLFTLVGAEQYADWVGMYKL